MNIWIVVIIGALVLGIILLSGKNVPIQRKGREQMLKEFADFWEGAVTPLAGQEDAYSIAFKFDGRDFIFDAVQDKGFQKIEYKGFLRTRAATDLTVEFTEAPRSSIKSNIIQASHIKEPTLETVVTPKDLKVFSIFSNRPGLLNGLFRDYRVLDIFLNFKSAGARGEPVMPLRVQDGLISLEFVSSHTMKANLDEILQSPAKSERFVASLTVLAKGIEAEQARNH